MKIGPLNKNRKQQKESITSLSSSATCEHKTVALFTRVFNRNVVNAGGKDNVVNNA